MGMVRGTALVANIARVVQLTGVQDLLNLESDSELTVADLLTSASDIIYDRLEGDGVDPTALTNQLAYEQAVAWEFLSILADSEYITPAEGVDDEGMSKYRARVERHYMAVRPKTSGDDPRRANESIPSVGNFERGWAFADGGDNRQDEYTTWLPESTD